MCGITGWVDWKTDLSQQLPLLDHMVKTLAHRGPDASGTWLSPGGRCALGHRRLSVIDPANGAQPMQRTTGGRTYSIVYNGELYNTDELRKELERKGHRFQTRCDTEVLLVSYIEWGAACLDRLTGIFAFAVWTDEEEKLFMARDRLGVKPLFYTLMPGKLLFASEPKAILAHPEVPAEVDAEGFAEIFALGPARTPGHGVYKHMAELKPGYFAEYDRNGFRAQSYWQLESRPHPDNEADTIEKVRELVKQITESQLVSDVPVCMLLSGGLDSSALTAIARNKFQERIHTFSVDYVGNDRHFKANTFQPEADAPWIKRVSNYLGTIHHNVELTTPDIVEALKPAVLARDLPGMADVDSSLLLFCKTIKEHATVALSGEGADELFGGYPWFHRDELFRADTFPWSVSISARLSLLSPDFIEWIQPESYVAERYRQALEEVPRLPGEHPEQHKRRQLSYLNLTRFMPTLLDRKDRMSMAVGLEVRVPFCDHRLVEYVWNIPWEIKTAGGREKGVLREALRGILPDDVLFRKKSPYPKTYDPQYIASVQAGVLEILGDPNSPLRQIVDVEKAMNFARLEASQLHLPWFGQLMSGPQMLAYLIQVDYWMREYRITMA